ncbi:MAG: 4Fe-4S dicluster domain-containing protein, partial [Promethearchaeota archaeon]
MSDTDYYEKVRQKLSVAGHGAPKHKKVIEFLKVIWTEEEAELLSKMDGVAKLTTARKLSKKTGIDKKTVKRVLNSAADKGTILKIGSQYSLLPFVPGIFELYYLTHSDTEENLRKGAIIFKDIIDKVLPGFMVSEKNALFWPKLPLDAKEKIIEINESIETGSQVLAFESVEEMINRSDYYAKLPCQCRMVGEYSGNPCKIAPRDIGCFVTGAVARHFVAMGIGEELTKEESIDYLKRAEKAGLVHNGGNLSGGATHFLICNCCPCHCGALKPQSKYNTKAIRKSNFRPIIDEELCVACDTCLKKCPMNAIFHRWPLNEDSSDEKIIIREDLCIGCGVCAANCPKDAIKM